MKKLLSIICIISVLFTALIIPANAETNTVSVSSGAVHGYFNPNTLKITQTAQSGCYTLENWACNNIKYFTNPSGVANDPSFYFTNGGNYNATGALPVNDGTSVFRLQPNSAYKVTYKVYVPNSNASVGMSVNLGYGLKYASDYSRITGVKTAVQNSGASIEKGGTSVTYYDNGKAKTGAVAAWLTCVDVFATTEADTELDNILAIYGKVASPGIYVDDITVEYLFNTATPYTVTLMDDGSVIGTLQYTAGSELPELPTPAPKNDNSYFYGWSTDLESNTVITSNVLPIGVTTLYAVFREYTGSYTDSFTNTSSELTFPANFGGKYYPTLPKNGWSLKEYSLNRAALYSNQTWSQAGILLLSNPDGSAYVLRPYTKYKLTLKYKTSLFSSLSFNLGYGLDFKDIPDFKDDNFIYKDTSYKVTKSESEYKTVNYEFETDGIDNILPVIGVYANCGSKKTVSDGTAFDGEDDYLLPSGNEYIGYNCLQCYSLQIEEISRKSTVRVELNGGCADFNMTNSPYFIPYTEGSAAPVPYRYRYAFAGWYKDAALTLKAGETLNPTQKYYAAWSLFGDANNDGNIDMLDIVRFKRAFANKSVFLSAGADVNDDRIIDVIDLIRLKKYFAGYDVVLGTTRYIAFTYDDGPNEYFTKLVDEFKKYNGKCTFMAIGNYLSSNEDNLKYAVDNGFQIGNHTATHRNLQDETDREKIKNEFKVLNDRVYELTGYKITVGRFPNYGYNGVCLDVCDELKIAMFGSGTLKSPYDTDMEKSDILIKYAYNGCIAALHCTEADYDATVIALEELYNNGYRFVTVDELYENLGDTVKYGEINTKAVKQN